MIGGYFDQHPWHQEVNIKVEDQGHPATRHLGRTFKLTDEIYQFKTPPYTRADRRVLLALDLAKTPKKGGMNRQDNDYAVAWIKTYTGPSGKVSPVFATTMGHAGDLKNEGFRRLLVNACYWCLGMEEKIPDKSKVDLVGEYKPRPFGFRGFAKGVKPEDHKLP